MKKKSPIQTKLSTLSALVIATFGRHALAKDQNGKRWQIFCRGKKQAVAVGDFVGLEPSAENQAWVTEIFPRKNLLYRSDAQRTKVFAANLDQVILMIAPSPPLSPELVLRTWLACATANIELILVFNKTDLLETPNDNAINQTVEQVKLEANSQATTKPTTKLTNQTTTTPTEQSTDAQIVSQIDDLLTSHSKHIDLLELRLRQLLPLPAQEQPKLLKISIKTAPDKAKNTLLPHLSHHRTLVLGQSGMGKSSLINLLVPQAQVLTAEISQALNTGKHTTTHTQIHPLDCGGEVIDSPGFQAFGLAHLENSAIDSAFSYLLEPAENCRFYNCKHINEPGCAVIAAVKTKQRLPQWLMFYHQFKAEIRDSKRF